MDYRIPLSMSRKDEQLWIYIKRLGYQNLPVVVVTKAISIGLIPTWSNGRVEGGLAMRKLKVTDSAEGRTYKIGYKQGKFLRMQGKIA